MSSAVKRPRYRTKAATFYTDEKIMTLPPVGKLIADYILTGPQVNRCGIFCFSPAKTQEDLGLSSKIFTSHFEQVLSELNWIWDRAARVLFIPTWWRYNTPDNPNVLVAALADLNILPNTPLLKEFAGNVRFLPPNHLQRFIQRLGERFGERLGAQESVAGFRSSSGSSKQENEHEDSPLPPRVREGAEGVASPSRAEASEVKAEFSADWLVATWNALGRIEPHQGPLGRVGQRRLRKRLKEDPGRTTKRWWLHYFQRIARTDVMNGNETWFPPLLWVLETKNMEKILSGYYGSASQGDY
jgi:hypothetical protein